LARVQTKLAERLGIDVDILTLMQRHTIRRLAEHIRVLRGPERAPPAAEQAEARAPSGVGQEAAKDLSPRGAEAKKPTLAIVGMAIRAPGARNPEELWEIIRTGRETIRVLDPAAMIAAGADPARVRSPDFVPAEGVLDDMDRF